MDKKLSIIRPTLAQARLGSLVPSLSARQIFIPYSMKNRRGKSGSKRHDDACRNVTEASHVVYFIFVNVIVRLRHECQRVCKQRANLAKDTRTKALNYIVGLRKAIECQRKACAGLWVH